MPISILGGPVASSGFKKYALTCNSSTTWTAPAGVTLVDAVVVGGGGGGGYSAQTTTNSGYNFPSGGGAGGAVVRKSISVTPGQTYTITVGAGGNGGVPSSSGSGSSTVAQAGGSSSFGWTYNLLNGITNGAREFSNSGWRTGKQSNSGSITNPPSYPNYDNDFGNTGTDISSTYSTISGISIGSNTPHFTVNGLYPSGVSTSYGEATTIVQITAGTQYTASAYFVSQPSNYSCNVGVTMSWYTGTPGAGGSFISHSSSGSSQVSGTTWSRKSVTATAPGGATHVLVRFQFFSPGEYGGGGRFTGAQLESGASVTTYKNFATPGSQIIPGVGVVSTLTGAVAVGGGGGQSYYWSSTFDGVGYGGGATNPDSGYYGFGGNGSGAGGPIGLPYVEPTSNVNPFYIGVRTVNNGLPGAFSAGGTAITYDPAGKLVIQPNGAPATFDGFGAGGMGAYKTSTYPGQVGTGGGAGTSQGNGNNGVANTGGGGSGANCYESPAGYYFSGGNGGSGVVLLSWMGA